MKILIVYESMFGNTRKLADAMVRGLESAGAETTSVAAAIAPDDVEAFDLVIVGAPTHAHSLPRPSSREQAATWAADASKNLVLEEYAERPGVREWLATARFLGDAHPLRRLQHACRHPPGLRGRRRRRDREAPGSGMELSSNPVPSSWSISTTVSWKARRTVLENGRSSSSPDHEPLEALSSRPAVPRRQPGFALLIWVFVQMIFIPFSFLQLVYFAFGIAEVGLVMLASAPRSRPRRDLRPCLG